MHVHELMTHAPAVCTTSDHLTRAAQIMWERDCGAVPVIDASGQLAGIVTDRDLCMAAYTQGRAFHEIRVESVMSKVVFTVGPDTLAADALHVLNSKAVRRLPVVDAQGRLLGMLSLSDFVRVARAGIAAKTLNEASIFAAFASVSAARNSAPSPRSGSTGSQPAAPLPKSSESPNKQVLFPSGAKPAEATKAATAKSGKKR